MPDLCSGFSFVELGDLAETYQGIGEKEARETYAKCEKFISIGVPPAVIESKLEEQNTVILNLTKTVSEL